MIKRENREVEGLDNTEPEEIIVSVFPESIANPEDEVMRSYRIVDEDTHSEELMWQPAERERVTFSQVRDDIELVRCEIDRLKGRLTVIAERAATVMQSRAEWADAAAHAQLGDYPWAKLAGAMAGAFMATRILSRLPLGALATVVAPAVLATLQRKASK